MRILVLGNSDTRGEFAPGVTWPEQAAALVSAATREEVSIDERRFSATRPDAPAFAATLVEEVRPDLVLLPLGTFAFTAGFTWVRVQRFFGVRVANWYRKGEAAMDSRTRNEQRLPNSMGRTLRGTMRRLVGTQPMTTSKGLATNYRDVLRALAQAEDCNVLVVAYPPERATSVTVRDAFEQRRMFLEDVAAEAALHRFHLVDSMAAYHDAPNSGELFTPDGFHSTAAGHQVLGAVVAAGILALP